MTSRVSIVRLKQGLAECRCPLCLVAHDLDREYVSHLLRGWAAGEAATDVLAARGICGEHAQRLVSMIDGPRCPSRLADLYAAIAKRLALDLAVLEDDAWLQRPPCPACESRRDGVASCGQLLLDELGDSEAFRGAYERSGGVCLNHFELLWDTSRVERERTVLRAVQLRVAERLAEDLRQQASQGQAQLGDGNRRTGDAWRRAIHLTSGWSGALGGREPNGRARS